MTTTTALADGRFELHELLGEGGMALVYRAWDTRLRRWCAIKVLRDELARRRSLRERFEREAQAMALLDHRHIVRVFDVGGDDTRTWIVMELCRSSLDDWLSKHGPMPPRLAVGCMLEVVSAIEAAHGQGIVHRDLKPQNVLLTEQGTCRVGDFGIAQVESPQLTRTGTAMGTLGFMPPEQRADAKAVDARSDVYALGATLYTLVTDRVSMDLHAADRDPELLDGVPEVLRGVVMKATAYHPAERYQRARDLRLALREALALLPAVPPDTPPLADPARPVADTLPPFAETLHPPSVHQVTLLPRPQTEVERPSIANDAWERRGDEPTVSRPKAAADHKPLPWIPRARGGEDESFDHLYQAAPAPARPDHIRPEDEKYVLQTVPFDPHVRAVDAHDAGGGDPNATVGGTGAGWAVRQILEFAAQIGVGLLKSSRYVLWPVALLAAVLAWTGTQSTSTLRAHEAEVTTRATAMESALDRDPELVDELIALGAPESLRAQLHDYQRAADPDAKRKAAARLAREIEGQAVRLEDSPDPVEMTRRKALRKRVDAVGRARRGYAEALRDFETAADSMSGGFAVRLGLAPAPPPE